MTERMIQREKDGKVALAKMLKVCPNMTHTKLEEIGSYEMGCSVSETRNCSVLCYNAKKKSKGGK